MLGVTVTVDTRALRRLTPRVEPALDKALDLCASERAADARERAHVITGAMRASTGHVSPLRDDLTGRQTEAAGLNAAAGFVRLPLRPKGHTALIAVGVDYAVYEEYGTRYRPPHPWFWPAMASAQHELNALVTREIRRAINATT